MFHWELAPDGGFLGRGSGNAGTLHRALCRSCALCEAPGWRLASVLQLDASPAGAPCLELPVAMADYLICHILMIGVSLPYFTMIDFLPNHVICFCCRCLICCLLLLLMLLFVDLFCFVTPLAIARNSTGFGRAEQS
ncbi:unnamed protein product [Polarella glacialis]|uniref:Uncharacterized protein n=1 Tax=Polarella glacialis TaxID=89957 RepID=A0A813DCG4_POLGL|nr:unnamed protein product [Polarella glacialis]CAE8692817.1 unnamed protein product [Polarella glacialis]